MSDETFGSRLKQAMREKGVRLAAVAETTGVTLNTVSKWRSNIQRPPHVSMEILARFLDADLPWLAYGNGDAVTVGRRSRNADEFAAMRVISTAMDQLTDDERERVIDWIRLRYDREETTQQ